MSATGLDVFDRTLQTTHIWLGEISAKLDCDRQTAWKALSVVLRKLRDRMPVELSAHLSAELPLLVRGVYYDQFDPTKQPTDWTQEDFTREVSNWMSDARPVVPRAAIAAVFSVLSHHVPRGQIAKVRAALPADMQAFWIAAEDEAARAEGWRRAS